jgi:hypothetical protein
LFSPCGSDNYYLGKELPIEFSSWKQQVMRGMSSDDARNMEKSLNCLWFESAMDTIASGDVFNPGGKGQIPTIYTIDSPLVVKLGSLNALEAFKTTDENADAFEIIVKRGSSSICRNKNGDICVMQHSADVRRLGNLSRGAAGGLFESNVSIAAFPVGHVVCRRTLHVNKSNNGEKFIAGYIGDAQASPHFMRYSGLT